MTEQSQEFILPAHLEEVPFECLQQEMAQSYEVVKKLLPFLAKRGIPVTPKNFRLFYDYITFINPELTKILNGLLEKEIKFHSRLSDHLYVFFYAGENADFQTVAITKAASEFMDVSSTMSASLRTAREQHDRFQKTLFDTSRQVADLTSSSDLLPFLDELLAETERTLISGEVVATQLKEANDVIAALKAELKNQTTLANIDELTKLSNRHHFSLEAPKILRESVEKGRPLSAIVFDIDFFKKINDTWGHAYGDRVLTVCADIIKNAARSTDLAVRMGGEEFLLICANLNLATAGKVADRIRQSIASTDIAIRGQSLSVTISGGVAEYVPGEDMTSLIGRADRALYEAKESGRNLVCLAKADAEPLITRHGFNLTEGGGEQGGD